ncbi:MAG: DUF389 domain-containing protein [Acidimicrobiales bacterium]
MTNPNEQDDDRERPANLSATASVADAVSDVEADDVGPGPLIDLARFDLTMLRSPAVIQAFAVIAVATLVLLWPQRSGRILSNLTGVGLVILSATSGWTAIRSRPFNMLRIVSAAAGMTAGLFLVASPDRSDSFLGRLIAAAIVITGLRHALSEWRDRQSDDERAWLAVRTLALLAAAGLLAAFPVELLSATTTVAAFVWILISVLVIRISIDRHHDGAGRYADSGRLITDWLAEQPKSIDDRETLYRKILYDGPIGRRRISRFFTLMTFASVIASMGVITDSTAVVIGAMLIAPLMTPLMGMAVSLVMGWPRRLGQSALIAFGGIVLAIGIGAFLGLIAPTLIDPTTNTQILSRATPTMLDLLTAVAAGAAGAYGLSRPDVSDALPGVAIAISLVPPLAVVGIAYSQGDWGAGNGALLLFSTNMLAILIVGGLTFIVTGVAPIERLADNQHRVRTSAATVATMAAMVIGLLTLNGTQITENLLNETTIDEAIEEWIDPHPEHRVARVTNGGDTISIAIVGPAEGAPRASGIASLLSERLDRTTTADVRLIVEERDIATGGGG